MSGALPHNSQNIHLKVAVKSYLVKNHVGCRPAYSEFQSHFENRLFKDFLEITITITKYLVPQRCDGNVNKTLQVLDQSETLSAVSSALPKANI